MSIGNREGLGEEGVEGEPIKIGYTTPKNTVSKRLVVVKRGTEEVKEGAWHLGSTAHNVLKMRHKGRWHAFGSEHAQIRSVWGASATTTATISATDNHPSNHYGFGNPKSWRLVGCLCREAAE